MATDSLSHKPNGLYDKYFKRLLDIVLSSVALICLSPFLIVVAILVRFKLGTPIVFKQERPGLNEKIFTLYKFRTMTDEKDANGHLLNDSERLTKFGIFLRRTSLDELPELFNILIGDMSIVGPRPLLVKYLPYYREAERLRSKVRPGITGLAQISGRNALDWDERFKTDIVYINNISLLLDLEIVMKTMQVVLIRKDILVGTEHILKDLDVERKEEFNGEISK